MTIKLLLLVLMITFFNRTHAQSSTKKHTSNTNLQKTNSQKHTNVKQSAKQLPAPHEVNPVGREQMSNDEFNSMPIENRNHQQTEPPVGKDFIEKWIITSARTADSLGINGEYLLDSTSYFIFLDGKHIKVKLNTFFPEQIGTFTQSINWIEIKLSKPDKCITCIDFLKITRNSVNDREYKLTFNGVSQFFTILNK